MQIEYVDCCLAGQIWIVLLNNMECTKFTFSLLKGDCLQQVDEMICDEGLNKDL